MNKCATLLFAVLVSASASAQLGEIDWTTVQSRVAWFNGYEQPGLYTLRVNGVAALRNQASGGLFSPTKFPSGAFSLEITDSRNNKPILTGELIVKATGDHLLVTSGNDVSNSELQIFHSADFPVVENKKRLCFVNARTGAECHIEILLPEGEVEKIAIDGTFAAVFDASETAPVIKLVATSASGQTRTEQIQPRELPPNGAIFIVHTDSDYFTALKISTVSAETFSLIGADDEPTSTDE